MEIYFNRLANVLPANDKKENVRFLLSEKIANCSNSLSNDAFFILKDNVSNVYVDKNILTKIKNELTDVINEYIKDDLHHLDKINKANNKCGGVFLDRKNINYLEVINLNSLDIVKKFILTMINETGSSFLKKKLFDKDKNPTVNFFFDKGFFRGVKEKSVSELIKSLKNKIIVLNEGCDLPFKLNDNDIALVKLGDIRTANNNVSIKEKKEAIKINNDMTHRKVTFCEFEILFQFLLDNINNLYKKIIKYNNFIDLEQISHLLSFENSNKELIENIRKLLKMKNDIFSSVEKLCEKYSYFNDNCKNFNMFYQSYVNDPNLSFFEENNQDLLLEKINKLQSNKESLDLELKKIKPFSDVYDEYSNKIRNLVYNLVPSNKKISCDSIDKIKGKLNECKTLIDDRIQRNKNSFLFKVYRLFSFWKKDESTKMLIEYKNEINNLISYLDVYEKTEYKYFSINEVCLIATSILSKINNPKGLISYMSGEISMWENFKKSLFKK
ncbi:TPA: hypothetical protein ACXI1D_001579 [Proteus mirabilis]